MKSYYISFDNVSWTEFYPSNRPKVALKPQGGEIFFRNEVDVFRINRVAGSAGWVTDINGEWVLDVNGKKISAGNEGLFDELRLMFFDKTRFSDTIYLKIQKSGVDKYFFKVNVNEIKLDDQNYVIEISPRVDDDYQDIMDKYEVEWQDRGTGLFGENAAIYYPTLDPGAFTNVDFTTFNDAASTITWTNTTSANVTARNAIPIITTSDSIYIIIISNFSGDTVSMELVDNTFSSISDIIDIDGDGKYTVTQNAASAGVISMELTNDGSNPQSGVLGYEIFYPVINNSAGGTVENIIDSLLNGAGYMNLSYIIKSTFLWNDALESDPPPNIDTYITANPTKDYVVEDDAIWNEIFLTRTDFWTTTQNVSVELSFKDLMDILKGKLRAWWFIDSDGDFRIEHEKYFKDYTPQIDVTTPTYTVYLPEVDALIYTYDKGNIYSTINNSELNANTEDFVAYPIAYNAELTTPKALDISVDATTDIKNVVDNPDGVSNDGVTLLRTIKSGNKYHVDMNNSILSPGSYYPNLYLAWSYLFENYFSYYGESAEATINGSSTLNLDGVKEFLKQENITFPYIGELDWYKPITTTNGTAWIQSLDEEEEEVIKINVGFDPYL